MLKTLFPTGGGILQDHNASVHEARLEQLLFGEHKEEVKHLLWPTQSPDVNINEPFWSILELSIWSLYPPHLSFPELSLIKYCYNIPTNIIQHLYKSIPKRIQTELRVK